MFVAMATNPTAYETENIMQIVVSTCYGGFSLSPVALAALTALGVAEATTYHEARDLDRNDARLIAVVEQLGAAANGYNADLAIVTIPDDVDWTIEEYDGREWVAERHRTWHA